MANRSRIIKIDMTGLDELLSKLRNVAPKLEKRELRKAVSLAAQLVLKTARQKCPIGPGVDPKGKPRIALRRTLGKKVKQYDKAATAVVGPRYGEAWHSHLVHDGTKPHDIPLPAGKSVRMKSGYRVTGPYTFKHPGAKANPFMADAWQACKVPALGAMKASLRKFFRSPDL